MRILFFDGYCILCNALVDFLISRDPNGTLKFASLQGETAKSKLPLPVAQAEFQTVVYFRDGAVFERSAAIIQALDDLGGGWSFARVLFLVPLDFRDFAYDWIAARRYSFFVKRGQCRVPSKEDSSRLLN
jgi:predicted DCC family thiol-disulfide oxidoreductase YuxK